MQVIGIEGRKNGTGSYTGGADEVNNDDSTAPATAKTTMGLVELMLKQPAGVDALSREAAWQRELFPRFLLISEASFLVYALIMVLVLHLTNAAWAHRPLLALPAADGTNGSSAGLVLGYTVGILLAAGVCLPSFYFYSLLAGVKLSWLQISSLIARGTAANAILLSGILPVYVAVVLGMVVFQAPAVSLEWAVYIGLSLPFLTGVWGLRTIYLGVVHLSAHMPYQGQCRRLCFLRRLVLSWALVYATVVPVMIYRLWEVFAGWLQIT